MAKTQTRVKTPPPAAPKATTTSEANRPPHPMHPFAFALGLMAILVGMAASGMLALSHFKILQLPGCGTDSGCDSAAKSDLGHIPVPGLADGWPTSHLGFAYFCAIGAAWFLSRKGMSTGLRVMITLGAIGSLFYATNIFMHLDKYLCEYCLACHAANFVLLGLTFMGTGHAKGSARVVSNAGFTFVLATAALVGLGAWSDKAAHEKGQKELNESLANLNEKTDADIAKAAQGVANASTTAPTTGKEGTIDPQTGVYTPTVAPPQVKGEISRGAPEIRDRPMAIEVKGYTAGKGFTGHYRIGYEDAPIRIVIFSDYQCNDCKRVEKELFRLLEGRKDISYSHRHFPFCRPCNQYIARDMHPNACFAAIAAEVAGELKGPEGFWQMHKWLFDRGGGFTDPDLEKALVAFGYDPVVFQQRMMHIHNNGGAIMDRIQGDVSEANALGLHYTPMMFVNGVEIRAFQSAGALTQAVSTLAGRNPPLGSPENDRPSGAFEKYIADWEAAPSMGPLGPDRFVAIDGNPDAKVRIEAFIDYGSTFSAKLDAQIREAMQGRDDVAYVVRHFPTSVECTPRIKQDINKNSCEMSKAAEAAGRLGGPEAYFKVHNWLLANQATYSTEALKAFLPTVGLEPEKVLALFDDLDVIGGIQDDTGFMYSKNILTIPHVFVNYKSVPRWDLEGHDVVRAVVERAADVE